MSAYLQKLNEAKNFLASRFRCPDYAIVLGSGLGGVLEDLDNVEAEIPFSEIPHLAKSNVAGHKARLLVGSIGGVRIVGVQGRLHFYEGHPMEQVVFLVRALALQGVDTFLLTNAAGGLNDNLRPRDLLLITDHINLIPNPLMGPNEAELGPRFPDMSDTYDAGLRAKFLNAAVSAKVDLKEGVYLGITGPTYETAAEVRMYRGFGADVVGMSTVPEAVALRHMGKNIIGLSCVTNLTAGVGPAVAAEAMTHDEVLKGAGEVKDKMIALLRVALPLLGE